jgi:outer membrane protein insertion porin family
MNRQDAVSGNFPRRNRFWQWIKAAVLLFAILVAVFRVSVHAQEAQPDSYAGFEGRGVSRIEISAGASTDTEGFRALIKQKEGVPFSAEAIRESVDALEQTNQFAKVRVNVEPQQSGLAVQFILEPALYVGMISLPGAPSGLAYTRLLQAVNIPEQSPYFGDLLPLAQKSLQHFLQVEGYFAASVQPEVDRDEVHKIANLTFRVHPGPHAKLGNITIAGVTPEEAAHIRSSLHSVWARVKRDSLWPGQQYSQSRIDKALDYIRAHLRGENHLAPSVRLASAEYDPHTNRAELSIEVNPGPIISVEVTGAHLWKRTIRHQLPIYEENAVDRDLVDEGERNLESYFQSKGYFDIKIQTTYSQQADRVTVEYRVDRGRRHKVESVGFSGNHYFSDQRLAEAVAVKKGHTVVGITVSRGKFSDQLVQNSAKSIEAVYKDAGFAKVLVTPDIKDHPSQVDVTFQISEGEQDKVNTLRLEGNKTEPRGALSGNGAFNLQPGKPYSARLLDLDRSRILAIYLDRGYLNANFKASVSPLPDNPHLWNVVYSIKEGPQGHVRDVVILGENVTKPGFTEDVIRPNISPEKPLSEGKFFTSESELYSADLNIFDWVSVKPRAPISDQDHEDVLVKVHESKRYSMDIGGGIEVIPRSGNIPVGEVALPGIPPVGLGTKFTVSQKSFFGPRFTFDIAKHNIRGRAETATFSTILSRLDQRGAFTYSDPRLRGSQWSSLFSLSGERTTENPIFTARLGAASFQVQRFLDTRRTKRLVFRYSFQRTDLTNILIPDLVLPQDQRVRLSTVSAEYIRDSRDNPLDAHRGAYQTLDFGVTPSALGSNANFARFLGQNAFYIPVRHWLTWANNFRLGLATPFAGTVVPLSERFFTGGADSLRGFPINGAGPQRPVSVCSNPSNPSTCTDISVPVGGNMLFILNSEARFPAKIVKNLGAVLFYDGGNVYSNVKLKQLIDDYTNTVGIGLRYATPVGPVRFDIGYRLSSVPGVNATQYFVTLGQSF